MSDGEMIYDGIALSESDLVRDVQATWKQQFYLDSLAEFDLELSSTGSVLQIVFKSVKLKYLSTTEGHTAPAAYPTKPG